MVSDSFRGHWFAVALISVVSLASPVPSAAQTDSISHPVYHLDEVVAVADRTGSAIRETVAATSLLTREDIEALPAETLPEVLRHVPGLVFVERDGSGRLPMAVVRGFFGGGETSYVLLTVDGVPVNDERTGLVEWTQIPLSEIQRIEVLRGSASVMYGDAALGAVVNVVTRGNLARPEQEVSMWGGSWGGRGVQGRVTRPAGAGWVDASLHLDGADGYRSHSESSQSSGAISYHRTSSGGTMETFGRLTFSRIRNQDPGPLPPEPRSQDPLQSLSVFSGDERTRTVADATAGISRSWPGIRRFDAVLRLRAYDQERTRTLLLAPTFGNTQRQDDESLGAWSRVQYSLPTLLGHLRVGVEGEGVGYDTRYRDPDDGAVLNDGKGKRLKLAGHAEATRKFGGRVSLHAGIRYDLVRSDPSRPDAPTASFDQWSPRVALNVAFSRRPSTAGNLFVTWTRAFKAPTLDQLFDVRSIPTGEPGQAVSFSNAGLKPQRSSAIEAGIYQRLPFGDRERFAEISATVYRQWLDDEIDFDLRTFKYGNIQRSRHTGVEAAVRMALSSRLGVVHTFSYTRATFRSSELEGNQLKNIPETALVTSGYLTLPRSFRLALTHRVMGSVFLDDENTSKLDGSSLVDASLAWSRGPLGATLTVQNLLDTRFESFGYLLYDPFQQTDVRMTHPGAGRGITVKLSLREGGAG